VVPIGEVMVPLGETPIDAEGARTASCTVRVEGIAGQPGEGVHRREVLEVLEVREVLEVLDGSSESDAGGLIARADDVHYLQC
jgi:hypothetical protein